MTQITSIDELRALIKPPHPLMSSKVLDRLDCQSQEFVARSPFLLLATQNGDGSLEVSPKGDKPGFVHMEDDRTLLLPDRAGNNLAFGLTNLLSRPQVGMIFLLPATGETLRVSGLATLHDDRDLCTKLAARGKPAKLFLRIRIAHTYIHCARSILRANLWRPDTWTPTIKVSFGQIVRERINGDAALARRIDEHSVQSYRDENL